MTPNTLDAYFIRPIDGQLRIISRPRLAAHLVITDTHKALREIEQRGHVTLWAGENKWPQLKRLWAVNQAAKEGQSHGNRR